MTKWSSDMTSVVLDIDNLVVGLGRNPGNARIIDDVSLQVRQAETLCLVGESGSGKSVTALTVMGLLQKGALLPCGGSVRLVGEELLSASDHRARRHHPKANSHADSRPAKGSRHRRVVHHP